MQRISSIGKGSIMRSVAFSLVFSTLFIAVSVGAASTISTNITTGGNLTVSGTAGITGLTTLVYASSTSQSLTGNLQVAGGMAVGSAMTNSLAGTILLSAQSSDPTGVTQGTFYYNSTNKTLKMYDGSNWFTVGTTTSGISLSGSRLQLSDLTLQFLTIGTTTQQGVGQSMLTLEATSTTAIPLSIVGFTSHTGHLLDVLNGSSAKLFYLSASGGLFASSTGAFGGSLTVGGALIATSTLAVTGTSSFTGIATIAYASTTATTNSGTASTSALVVGGNSINGTLSGIIFGTCDIVQRALTASTTGGFACTGATGITTSYKVFVMATSSIGSYLANPVNGFVVAAASSTALNTIGVELSNLTGVANTPAGTLNFWAVR